ncbi:tenascin [Amia ocellicauda]|uniref:tenascin n=1 Tax=Amia ocellicauda TaxID=2972642 RepID=UPI003464AC90
MAASLSLLCLVLSVSLVTANKLAPPPGRSINATSTNDDQAPPSRGPAPSPALTNRNPALKHNPARHPVLAGRRPSRQSPPLQSVRLQVSEAGSVGRTLDLHSGSPLVLTHRINLLPPATAGSCACGAEDLSALRERLERLEAQLSELRGRCGGDGPCCTAPATGPGCLIAPTCPEDCNDQGRCEGGRCVCFPGFSGPDCSIRSCPGNCSNRGQCVNGKCVCDTGFTGTDCSATSCPANCNSRGQCVNGKCVCDTGFTGTDCSATSCPANCNSRGQCVNGKCVCDTGFTGTDCSTRSCPANCNNRGQCVNGKCVCDTGFTGTDCSATSCPANCNSRGQCVNGKCVCDTGFTGTDCSTRSCPSNCNNRGQCVNGKCVCDTGFTGTDCSTRSCPSNCNNRGQCVNGKCVCDTGFTGTDCSTRSCPSNCNNRGQCVNGKCVCDTGFTGTDCSTRSCAANCNNRGQCVNGKCVCDTGFTGTDCSTRSCPANCNNRGQCVNGKCVCDTGFTGTDCSARSCPANCNNRGQCVNGKCVCDTGFTGMDCSTSSCRSDCSNHGHCLSGRCVCESGFTGNDCSLPLCPGDCSGHGRCVEGECSCDPGYTGLDCGAVVPVVSKFNTNNITDSSVTLTWTLPPKPVDTYHITLISKKEGDQKVTSKVRGDLSSYTQTGLAPAQDYRVSIRGERANKLGPESIAEFKTLISGPKNVRVVKTTSSSVLIQWDRSVSQIDRYRLTFSPSDGGEGLTGQKTISPERETTLINGLEAGLRYDVTLTAEQGRSRSLPATIQATPGPAPPSQLMFSNVSDSSVLVSWLPPRSSVSSFKITYIHTDEGEPHSVSVSGQQSSVSLTSLTPGSTYKVSVLSVLGLEESDPITGVVVTVPDPPSDLRVVNVTDSRALLLWRPALVNVDRYVIVYRAQDEPEVSVSSSGNSVELQLKGLQGETLYSVTVTSLRGREHSPPASTSFTTASGVVARGEEPRDLTANQVKPRSAMLSWKPPHTAVSGYWLTYQTDRQETQEVTLDPGVTQHKLVGLVPESQYTVRLRALRGEQHSADSTAHFTTGSLRFPFPVDCSQELLNGMAESGETTVYPGGQRDKPLRVYCDMETDGGGWIVFQRRMNGKTNFFRFWKDYRDGFGNLTEEFWLGNKALHLLTREGAVSLRVDLRAEGQAVHALYSSFNVTSEHQHYRLTVGGYSGTAGDALQYHDGRPFSTRDRDPQHQITRCAMSYKGGWWYKNCHYANLNGLYNTHRNHQGVIWTNWKGNNFSIAFTEMKLRPAGFSPSSPA